MSDKRKSLGRGLDALLGQSVDAEPKNNKQGLTERKNEVKATTTKKMDERNMGEARKETKA